MKRENPKPETRIAAASFLRLAVFAFFPLGYVYWEWKTIPIALIVWGIIMSFIAVYGAAKNVLYEKIDEEKIVGYILKEQENENQ